jgi:hypothetical protein
VIRVTGFVSSAPIVMRPALPNLIVRGGLGVTPMCAKAYEAIVNLDSLGAQKQVAGLWRVPYVPYVRLVSAISIQLLFLLRGCLGCLSPMNTESISSQPHYLRLATGWTHD